jgi:1-acyl-sn-glycerol-3-phosphate acyltransferase
MSKQLASMKPQVYTDPRPKEHFDRFHERSRTRDPDWAYEFVRLITSLYAYTLLRTRSIATDKVPATGAVILAPNHFSFMDHFLLGSYIRRKVRFMAKSQLFKRPLQFIYSHGGVFPVRRGARDEEAFITARSILDRGGVVAMYCEGGRSRTGELQERAKPGIGRLALESGAPIVPVAIHGSAGIRNWKRLRFPKISVQYGEPLRFERTEDPTRQQQQAVADEIFKAIKQLYAELERDGHTAVAARVRAARQAALRAAREAAGLGQRRPERA